VYLFACNKTVRPGYLNLDIEVTDEHTGEPVSWSAQVKYSVKPFLGQSQTGYEFIGGGVGHHYLQVKKPDKSKYYGLILRFENDYCGYPDVGYDLKNYQESVKTGKRYIIKLTAKRSRRLKFVLTNTTCTGPNDSVFIKLLERPSVDYHFVGCLNQYEPINSYGWSTFYNGPEINLRVKTIKNGVVDSFFVQQALQATGITPITINY
jgi:hypothetical protein